MPAKLMISWCRNSPVPTARGSKLVQEASGLYWIMERSVPVNAGACMVVGKPEPPALTSVDLCLYGNLTVNGSRNTFAYLTRISEYITMSF